MDQLNLTPFEREYLGVNIPSATNIEVAKATPTAFVAVQVAVLLAVACGRFNCNKEITIRLFLTNI